MFVCPKYKGNGLISWQCIWMEKYTAMQAHACWQSPLAQRLSNRKILESMIELKELFPEATFLQDHNAFAYCGFPSLDNHGKVVAVTCLLDDKPHDFTNEDQEILRIIGQRIGMEIERKHNLEAKERISDVLRINERQTISSHPCFRDRYFRAKLLQRFNLLFA